MWVSYDTIYRWIYYPHQSHRHRHLWQYLLRAYRQRRTFRGPRVCLDRILFRVSIHERPAHINDPSVFGHRGSRLHPGNKSCGRKGFIPRRNE